MKNVFSAAPEPLLSFLIYIENIQGKSRKTANEYFYDLKTFYRFLKIHFNMVPADIEFKNIQIDGITIDILKKVDLNVIYEYINFLNRIRNNSAATRARKISALRAYFNYLCNKVYMLENNPTTNLDTVKIGKRLPYYLTLDECINLLQAIDGENAERNYCIITLFLNCGLRLTELVNIDIFDIRDNRLTVIGKGNKERVIYLNTACIDAINNYMKIRNTLTASRPEDKNALFLSRNRRRISRRMVQTIVEKYISLIGLDSHKYTTHKLRHTAATLMYQSGVDVRALQEILGHEQLSTTQIYTHLNSGILKAAAESNPLANITKDEIEADIGIDIETDDDNDNSDNTNFIEAKTVINEETDKPKTDNADYKETKTAADDET